MSSVRFGRAHVFNNYFNSLNNNYCARTRLYAEVLVENNHYDTVFNPWELATSSQGPNGLLFASGNITNNCTFSTGHYDANLPNSGVVVLVPGTDTLTDPLLTSGIYPYALDAVADVPYFVQTYAGSGKYPYVAP